MKILTIPSSAVVAAAAVIPLTVSAMCPICTIAAVGGVEVSRFFGIDDTVTGLWLGGLTVSLTMWTETWLDKKVFKRKGGQKEFTIRFKGRILANFLLWTLLLVVPFMSTTAPMRFLGMSRILFGAIAGMSAFWFGGSLYEYLKTKNGGHAHFPFEKVAMPIAPLVLMSILFYLLTK